jgi:hypothetical protein
VVALDLRWHEADELAHSVEPLVAQLAKHLSLVVDVSDDKFDLLWQFVLAAASVYQPDLVAALGQLACDGTADGTGAADH